MVVKALRNEGGYEEYVYEITSEMKKVFMGVKKAYLVFYADNIKEAREIAKGFWDEKDIRNQDFQIDSNSILLEFENGNVIKIWSSEWGGITSIKKSALKMNTDYGRLFEKQ